jgi:DNA-binding XRE family transcriptional regulator
MDCQDWTPVIIKRRGPKKVSSDSSASIQERDKNRDERTRMMKLETSDTPLPKKRIHSESLQTLIRKRIELKLTQDKADALCSLPRNTFKEIEANRLIPSEEQKRKIHQNLGIQLKIDTVI